MVSIFVTGAGALLGQGILRCLNQAKNNYDIVSADTSAKSTGHALANRSYLIPLASDSNYLNAIESILQKENINIIMVGTDVELPIFSENQLYLEKKYNLKIIISPKKVIDIANDKFLTAKFLEENNFPFPISVLTTDKIGMDRLAKSGLYPYIAKPIDGARSKGIKIIKNKEELLFETTYNNNLVVQEMLDEDHGEFTTGCIVIDGKCVATVSLIRDLRDGNTWRAYRTNEVSKYDEIIASIAEKIGVEGPVNFQYRIKNGQPVIFEINGRFSGTTPLRLMFGFNEVEALVEYYISGEPIKMPKLKEGTILRTFSDIFVENSVIDSLSIEKYTENFCSTYYPFKN